MAVNSKAIHIRYVSKEEGFKCNDVFTDTQVNINKDNYKLTVGRLSDFEEQMVFIKQINLSVYAIPGYGDLMIGCYKGNNGQLYNDKINNLEFNSLSGVSTKLEKFLNGYLKENVDELDDWDIDKKVARLEKENESLKWRLDKINEIINSNSIDIEEK